MANSNSLFEKACKNLDSSDIQFLQDISNWNHIPTEEDEERIKKIWQKLYSWLNPWEKMRLTNFLLKSKYIKNG